MSKNTASPARLNTAPGGIVPPGVSGGRYASEKDVKSSEVGIVLEAEGSLQTAAPVTGLEHSAYNRSARELARKVTDGSLEMNPPYQRGSVWTPRQRALLVKSLLMRLPIPAVMINDRSSWPGVRDDVTVPWDAVIDGKQRLEATAAWFDDELPVPASWFPAEAVVETTPTADGPYVTFSQLTKNGQGMTMRAVLPAIEVKLPTVEAEAEYYGLVNTGGTAQTDEDLARAAAVAAQ